MSALTLERLIEADLGIFAEDSAHSSGDAGQQILGVRNDTRSSLSDTDGDYTPIQFTSNGDLRVRDDDANTSLSGIDTSLNNIETDIAALEKVIHQSLN